MGYIYKVINNINGKIYIGKTELLNAEDRWKEHLRDYKRRKFEKRPLYEAMNKYGEEHFSFEIIEETNSPEESCQKEQYWIEKLRTYVGYKDCKGYNATLGGDGKRYLNLDEDEVIKYYIEEAQFVVKYTAQHFNVDRMTIKKILIKNNIKTFNTDEYQKEFKSRSVCQIDVNTDRLLKIFKSYSDANEYMNKSRGASVIRMASYGKLKTAYGFKWMRYEDYIKLYGELKIEELVG